jgi:hypothetical protein
VTMRQAAAAALTIACLAAAGCDSPEARRTRGGGPGADSGNRPANVKMHEGSNPYWRTPERIAPLEHAPLESAQHAREISQP